MNLQQRVVQKLHYAEIELQLLAGDGPSLAAALSESIVLHLAGAYRALLRELAGHCKLPCGPGTDAVWLDEQCRRRRQPCPELAELAELEQGSGWLATLLHSARHCLDSIGCEQGWSGPVAMAGAAQSSQSPPLLPDLQLGREWHAQLASLVERLHETMREW